MNKTTEESKEKTVVFLQKIYSNLLNREADPEGLHHYLSLMQIPGYTQRQIVRLIKNSEEYRILHARGDIPGLVNENSRLNNQEIREGRYFLESKPPTFYIDLIGRCNMMPPCVMCLNWKGDTGPRHHDGLKKKDILRFGDFIRLSYNVINCGIGEPLLTKDFVSILQLFDSWEKSFGVNSNGIALTPTYTDKIAPFFDILTITFSVDAATADTYSKIRGNHFQRVIDNISYYCQKRQEDHPDGLASKVGMVLIPMRSNRQEITDFVGLAQRIGVDVVELRALNEIDHEVQVRRGDFLFDYRNQMLSSEELEEVRREAEKAAAEQGIILDCQYQVSEEKTYDLFLPQEFHDLDMKCILPWRSLLPYQNGDTVGCCYMTESLGNWREHGLEALWNSPRMQEMRKEMASGILPSACWNYASCPIVKTEKKRKVSERNAMETEEIVQKINEIKRQISQDNLKIIKEKIHEREFQVFKPNRMLFLGKIIQNIRKRLAAEVAHVLEPILDTQQEINTRLLKEIEKLKKSIRLEQPDLDGKEDKDEPVKE